MVARNVAAAQQHAVLVGGVAGPRIRNDTVAFRIRLT